jgi:hypothetical protein
MKFFRVLETFLQLNNVMKIMRLLVLCFFLLFFLGNSCKKENKDEGTLPPETQEGKNTFGFLLNGKLWKNGKPIWGANYSFVAILQRRTLTISSSSGESSTQQAIAMEISHFEGAKIYPLNNAEQRGKCFNYLTGCYYTTDTILHTGNLEITKFDTTQKIISGRFHFNAKLFSEGYIQSNLNCDPDVSISEGRFDLIYTNLN